MKKTRVLFVCLGNICRSPAAEGIFRALVCSRGLETQFDIDSAGTAGYHNGALPDKRMRASGQLRGYNFNSISRQLMAADLKDFDYVLTMDGENYRATVGLAVCDEERAKVKPMADFLTQHENDHIPDPYYAGANAFDHVIELLEDSSAGLLKHILRVKHTV